MAGTVQPRWRVKWKNGDAGAWKYVLVSETPEVPDLFPKQHPDEPRDFGRRYMAAAAASHAILSLCASAVEIEFRPPKTEHEPE